MYVTYDLLGYDLLMHNLFGEGPFTVECVGTLVSFFINSRF